MITTLRQSDPKRRPSKCNKTPCFRNSFDDYLLWNCDGCFSWHDHMTRTTDQAQQLRQWDYIQNTTDSIYCTVYSTQRAHARTHARVTGAPARTSNVRRCRIVHWQNTYYDVILTSRSGNETSRWRHRSTVALYYVTLHITCYLTERV